MCVVSSGQAAVANPGLRQLQIQDKRQKWRWTTRTVAVFSSKQTQPFSTSCTGSAFCISPAQRMLFGSCVALLTAALPTRHGSSSSLVTTAHGPTSLEQHRTLGFASDIMGRTKCCRHQDHSHVKGMKAGAANTVVVYGDMVRTTYVSYLSTMSQLWCPCCIQWSEGRC